MAKVFIVDDDILIVNALERALRAEGLVVEAPEPSHQLADNVDHDEPACLLLDLCLPGVTGLEIQRQLMMDATLPVIFLTGQGNVAASLQAMKQGAFEFLLKPPDLTVLLDTVRRALDLSADALRLRVNGAERGDSSRHSRGRSVRSPALSRRDTSSAYARFLSSSG